MKKRFALILVCCLVVLSMSVFVACDKNDDVTIKVYTVVSPKDEPSLEKTITIKRGSTFTLRDYNENYVEDDGTVGDRPKRGFYLDSACTQIQNRDKAIQNDTSFYILSCIFGTDFIYFIFEGKQYDCYIYDTTAKLKEDTFAVSAYGKEIDSAKLQYFADSEMTRQIEIAGKSFEEIDVEAVDDIPFRNKTVYVKRVE